MTTKYADELLALLAEEHDALNQRAWDKIAQFAEQKGTLIAKLDATLPVETIDRIKNMSIKNEHLLGVLRDATKAASKRLHVLREKSRAVAYEKDGTTLACAAEKKQRHV